MGILVQSDQMAPMHFDTVEGFEGFEKRLEVDFFPPPSAHDGDVKGLRALSRSDLDEMLCAAKCTIVSELSSGQFDSYVLSESSAFVYPCKLILKTCGTTKLLRVIPVLLAHAQRLSLKVKGCRYTRGSFLFPKKQPYPYGSFTDEVQYLEEYFGRLGSGSKAYVMGDVTKLQNWHIYSASAVEHEVSLPVYTLEMCMVQLDRKKALNFFKGTCGTAAEMTLNSGIGNLLPNSQICDFAFDPCGYSMNSVEGPAFSTIHVTPEDGYSYASFEVMGYSPQDVDLQVLVEKVLCCFKPASFSIALHASNFSTVEYEVGSWGASVSPGGYVCANSSRENLPGDSTVVFHTFRRGELSSAHVPPIPLFANIWAKQMDSCPQIEKLDSLLKKKMCHSVQQQPDFNCVDVKGLITAISPVIIGSTSNDMDDLIQKKIVNTNAEDAFYVMDIGALLWLWKTWKVAMPRIHPFYAVKCNADKVLLGLLAALGAGFDVASKAELDIVRSLGVGGDRIIFANPCKLPSHIRNAASYGVHLTTFDSEVELYKVWKVNPQAEVVLRIRICDAGARCPLGAKYGAEMEECENLLIVARNLGLQVVGVAFHVGSGATDSSSFAEGIAQARNVFDMAKTLGMPSLRLLDIGGGFVSDGGHGVSFCAAALAINDALEKFFPPCTGVTVIAEPGRFFAEGSFTLATQVFGSRMRMRNGQKVAEYWINDGIYGSMNCLLYDHAIISVRALPLSSSGKDGKVHGEGCHSTIFGPTCDGLDTLMQDVWLPKMQCGDWLIFPRMGAYTKAAASSFNGFDISDIGTFYVCSVG